MIVNNTKSGTIDSSGNKQLAWNKDGWTKRNTLVMQHGRVTGFVNGNQSHHARRLFQKTQKGCQQ